MNQLITTNQNTSPVLSPEKINLVKKTVAERATDAELELFLHLANKYDLDPFAKEIWFVKYKDTDKPQIFTSRDGYLKIAHQSGVFDGMESYTIDDEKDQPVKAVCKVYRKDMSRPFVAEIKVAEYRGSSQPWQKYPSAMAIKVAEVFALKRAFSISGLVTSDEITVEPQSVPVDPVNEPKLITLAQQKRLFVIAKSTSTGDGQPCPLPRWTDAQIKGYLALNGYQSSKDIAQSDYEQICKFFETHPGMDIEPTEND